MSKIEKYLNERRGGDIDYHKKCGNELKGINDSLKSIMKKYKKLKRSDLKDSQWESIAMDLTEVADNLDDSNYFYGK